MSQNFLINWEKKEEMYQIPNQKFQNKHALKLVPTGSNAAVVVAGVYGSGWLQFLAVLKDLYDWFYG